MQGTATVTATGSVELAVLRGINETRVAVLFLLITIGIGVGFGAPWDWWARLIAAIVSLPLSAAVVAIALRWGPARNRVMAFMHLLTGR